MALKWPNKDPDEVLDYLIDWAARMAEGDTIVTSTWIVPSGIIKDSDSFGDDTTTAWFSGGTIGTKYSITNRVVTAEARTMDQTVTLTIKAK
jgi:hypothetical protein